MTSDGAVRGMYGFLTSRSFRRIQERAIRSSDERVMAVQRQEVIKATQSATPLHGTYAIACQRSDFLVLSHATAWDFHAPACATNMSPIFVYFKAHPRGFELGL